MVGREMPKSAFSVAVLGPGGVGGLLAAVLAHAGSSVLVVAGERTTLAIARDGLQLESKRFGDFHVRVEAATRLAAPVDACFVTIKATQLQEALDRVPARALGDALVIPFLNGLEHVDYMRSVYPPASVVAATIRVESVRVGPGVICHLSPFVGIEIAARQENRGRVESVAAQLTSAGFDVRLRNDELAMLWDKFAALEPFALLTTSERSNAGAVRTRRRDEAVALISEVVAVAATDGVAIDGGSILQFLDALPGSMESSMQRDQAAGRPLELDALGGALLRRARKAGVAVPVTERLVEEIRRSAART